MGNPEPSKDDAMFEHIASDYLRRHPTSSLQVPTNDTSDMNEINESDRNAADGSLQWSTASKRRASGQHESDEGALPEVSEREHVDTSSDYVLGESGKFSCCACFSFPSFAHHLLVVCEGVSGVCVWCVCLVYLVCHVLLRISLWSCAFVSSASFPSFSSSSR
jgi:hypothetical protein